MARRITFQMCKEMTDYLVNKANSAGRPLAVAIVEPGGKLVSLTLMDGFHERIAEFAYNKAYTAAKMSRTGRDFRELCERDHVDVSDFCDQHMTKLIGSSPVWDKDGEIIGAIAVSGWTSDEDQALSEEAAALIRKRTET